MYPIKWYYQINGEEHGPVTSDDLRRMAVAGTLNPNDLVRKEDMDEWLPATRLKGLEFANTDYAPYDEEYDPDSETYDETEYVRTRGEGDHAQRLEYAGFWLRFCALMVDTIVTVVIFILMEEVMWVLGNNAVMGTVMEYALGILYFAFFESSAYQGTPGKLLLGIKVTDLHGRRISFLRALGRTFAKYLSAIIFLIGYIMAAFTSKKQALHDLIASTLVVKS
ncbi:RDD family protein [Polystyrenella longa]|uniref:RDD family protein n=1 Tax=Polystyrenella longa TaxID=2528007 RepID=A0A518CH28_9PLAN|nr:RDD family protein [Polystyrenella longa]QDU78530.1 RDD family protein [Polystyrenella longa]